MSADAIGTATRLAADLTQDVALFKREDLTPFKIDDIAVRITDVCADLQVFEDICDFRLAAEGEGTLHAIPHLPKIPDSIIRLVDIQLF